MFDALQIAATGMQAQQVNVDAIANNLANVNTPGFKKSRVAFFDLVTQAGSGVPAALDTAASATASSLRVGVGVSIANIARLFDAGDMRKTGAAMDVGIVGDGFFEVTMPDGSRAYARGGTLKVGKDGALSVQGGQALKPAITVPDDTQTLTIATDGKVSAASASKSTAADLGQLQMVRFANPGALTALGDNLYRSSDASGDPISGRAGEDAMGTIQQGFLEGSNVKMVDEMVNLMVAQRSYEASVKVVQASDEMLGMVNNLRK
jgi:flagellar basal-body rod protein FlgG